MEKHLSLCHVVRDATMTLFDRVEVGGVTTMLPFQRRVLWLRESEANIVLRWDGKHEVDGIATLCDYYGYLRSVEAAVTEYAATHAKAYKLTKADRLSVDVDVTITEIPVLEDTSQEAKDDAERYQGKNYRKSYNRVPTGYDNKGPWYTSDNSVDGMWPRLKPVVYFEKQSFYTTLRSDVGAVPAKLSAWIAEERRKAENDVSGV